ncbi:DNA repair protein RecO [Vagococcus lutrae LBD1]|uniref:DNA repair protein RecO n=1 Tax=Vagococcus lutrae LBD1 TaxID=1408226 RepID=V6Q5H7_9ENTE|nr:DNA repair protein RecO [Vagococcus lutrae]EST90486.1 DNA repair protein RecO [Vagococcus lutrae LBD1]
MNYMEETKALLLFTRKHREKDMLVKLFTEKYGKKMFFVKNVTRKNHPLRPALLAFTEANYIGTLKQEGLSFLNDAKDIRYFSQLQHDIFLNAYGTYILNLADLAIEDNHYDPALYGFTRDVLRLIDEGKDPEILTNLYEIQLLERFGVNFDWRACQVCGTHQGVFDFSSQYHGLLCANHFDCDPHRYHFDPKAVHVLRLLANVSLKQLNQIHVKQVTKNHLREAIDQLYHDFVGVKPKSKRFIDQMKEWEGLLKPLDTESHD